MTNGIARFRKFALHLRLSALITLGAAIPALGQQPDLIRIVADGKPWSLVQADGQTGQATLNADGTAKMQVGSMRVSPTWRRSENGQLCVKPAMLVPERCTTIRRDGTTIIGLSNGTEQYRLTRP